MNMQNEFPNLTSDYRIKRWALNLPIPYYEHLGNRAKYFYCDRAIIGRFMLSPDVVDRVLGFLNDKEEARLKETLERARTGGFFILPRTQPGQHFWKK